MNEAREIVAAVERERRRIGDVLHDQLCQSLAGTTLLMETIQRAVAAGNPVDPARLSALKSALEKAIDETRALSRDYNPVQLEGAGLMKALSELAGERFVCEKPVFVEDPEVALALFRVAQEAAGQRVELAVNGSEARLTVTDHTAGEEEIGLMQLRAKAVGGALTINGRTITFVTPLPRAASKGMKAGTA